MRSPRRSGPPGRTRSTGRSDRSRTSVPTCSSRFLGERAGASSERLADDSVAVPAEEPIDRMSAENGDVFHEYAVDGDERISDRLIHLRQAGGDPQEPEAAGLAFPST